jgi:hypothetical protein
MTGKTSDYQELVSALDDLSKYLDAVQEKLRVYDTALRFAESDYKHQAEIFKFCMAAARLPEMQSSASLEHRIIFERIRGLVVRIFQASSNPPRP